MQRMYTMRSSCDYSFSCPCRLRVVRNVSLSRAATSPPKQILIFTSIASVTEDMRLNMDIMTRHRKLRWARGVNEVQTSIHGHAAARRRAFRTNTVRIFYLLIKCPSSATSCSLPPLQSPLYLGFARDMPPKKSTGSASKPDAGDARSKDHDDAAAEPTTATNPPPRRSTRVASGTVSQNTSSAEKAAAPKKSRNASGTIVKDLEAKLRATTLGPDEKPKAQVKPQKEYLNPLPCPPSLIRPAPLLFVWGAGNAGQFGMGDEMLAEISKPQRNKLIGKMIEEGRFGRKGAGLENVAAGGMSSLFVDEQGTVSYT